MVFGFSYHSRIRNALFVHNPHPLRSGLKFRATVKWICILVGLLGGIASTVLHFKQTQIQQNGITKIPPTTNVTVVENNEPKDIGDDEDLESGGSNSSTPQSPMGDRVDPGEKRPESRY